MKRKFLKIIFATVVIVILGIIGGSLLVKCFSSNCVKEQKILNTDKFLQDRDSVLIQLNLNYAYNDDGTKYMDESNNVFSLSNLTREYNLIVAISTNTCWTCVQDHLDIIKQNYRDGNFAFICPDILYRSLHASLIGLGMGETKIYYSTDELFVQDLEVPLYIYSSHGGTYLHLPIYGRFELTGRSIQAFCSISGISNGI